MPKKTHECGCGFYNRDIRHTKPSGGPCPLHELRNLRNGERIIAVVPETIKGAGWSDRVVWVYIMDQDGGHRLLSLHPEEQTPEMWALFEAGAAMHRALVAAVPHKTKTRRQNR